MDKTYNPKDHEQKIYQLWEQEKYFTPAIDKTKTPFSIILPPPNANAPLHFGHAMYVVEDILIRYHRMLGQPTLWLPGADHAGFETQVVFEKHLAEEGKSRFDFDRQTLYQMIWDFVQANRGTMEQQLRQLGFSLDWTRLKFTLDPDIVKIVCQTFDKLYQDGLAYRAKRLVNYCTKDGTSFSDLEVLYQERTSPLYYIKYGPLTVATVRPETKFGDTAVAVHPQDRRYKKYIGREIDIETGLGKAKIKVIADDYVDPEFGTGVVKVTPAHDPNDFEMGQRHNLPMVQVINFDGTMNELAGPFAGMTVEEARQAVAQKLEKEGLLEKVDENYKNRVGICYKCGTVIEPLPLEQWFIKIKPLARRALEAVKRGKIKIYPKNFTKTYNQFLENIRDWNISRQIVWGIRIPAYKCRDSKLNNGWFVSPEKPEKCQICGQCKFEQDPDTFDTWFSSAQWPFATLKASPHQNDFDYFYPTTVMETGYDILRWWVARMVMVGVYQTNNVPFRQVVLHGLVKDPYGKKMSKSKSNVVNPLELVQHYGADSVRMALVYGTALGNDQSLSHPKLQAMRNFTNKVWNIARFVLSDSTKISNFPPKAGNLPNPDDQWIIEQLNKTITTVSLAIEQFRLHDATAAIYDFLWHQLADIYIEKIKTRREQAQPTLLYTLEQSLKLLHPFMPFVSETIWQTVRHHLKVGSGQARDSSKLFSEKALIIAQWPPTKK